MFTVKGLYEWELRSSDGNVDKKGSQWNITNDTMLHAMVLARTSSDKGPLASTFKIQLSSSPINPSRDYRVYGSGCEFVETAVGPAITEVNASPATKVCYNNFAPPVSARTIRIIGVKVEWVNSVLSNFASFIVLSTPITQNPDQYLYVKYTLFFNYVSGGMNMPSNRYLEFYINSQLSKPILYQFGAAQGNVSFVPDYYGLTMSITTFCQALHTNNIARFIQNPILASVPNYITTPYGGVNTGSMVGSHLSQSLPVASAPGPIGAMCRDGFFQIPSTSNVFLLATGTSPTRGFTSPTVSRLFVHPESRISQVFSDPAYPQSSNGSISVSGTPTNKAPIIGRIHITKTGDASPLVNEVFTNEDFNIPSNSVAVNQIGWATGDIVRFINVAAPAPLNLNTDYYIIEIDLGHVRFASSLSNAQNGIAIPLTGAVPFAIMERQNTAKFKYDVEKYVGNIMLQHLSMPVNASNQVEPTQLFNQAILTATTLDMVGEGDATSIFTYAGNSHMLVQGFVHIDNEPTSSNVVYSVQKSRINKRFNFCMWNFWTIESSEALFEFDEYTTVFRCMVRAGSLIFMAFDSGLWYIDASNIGGGMSLISSSLMVDGNVLDLAVSETDLWIGHATGLTKLSLSDLQTSQLYITGVGEELEGLPIADAYIETGRLSVGKREDGGTRVLVGGLYANSRVQDDWVLDDGVGWLRVNPGTGTTRISSAIRNNTNSVVVLRSSGIAVFDVVVTGKGIGSSTIGQTVAETQVAVGAYIPIAMLQMSDDSFLFISIVSGSVSNAIFKIGQPTFTKMTKTFQSPNVSYEPWRYAMSRNKMVFSRDNDGEIDCFIRLDWMLNVSVVPSIGFPTPLTFHNNRNAWIVNHQDPSCSPKMLSTLSDSITDGLSIVANNAIGKPWDQQFIAGERFTFAYGDMMFKDNLQTLLFRARSYFSNAYNVSDTQVVVPATNPATYHVQEASTDANFREVDALDLVVGVVIDGVRRTQYVPTVSTYTTNVAEDTINTTNIATGTPVVVTVANFQTSKVGFPLANNSLYYAINFSATRIRLARTLADALSNNYINLEDVGIGTTQYSVIIPTAGTYFVSNNGVFVFAQVDINKAADLDYTVTTFQ